MNELLSWGIIVAAVLALVGLGFAALQVVSSSDEFRIARGFFIIASIIAAGRIILWGITTPRSLTLRLIICFTTCGLIGISAIEAVRYVNRKRDRWISSASSVIDPPSVEESVETEEAVRSNFVCANTRLVDLGYLYGVLTEKTSEKTVRATVVAFANRGNTASMKNYVKARITFYDSEDRHFQHINNGVWLDEEGESIEFFDVGEVRELAIALMPMSDMAYAFDKEVMLDLAPAGKDLRVEVSLIGGIIPHLLGTYNFRLTLKPEISIDEIKG
ncbi:MAG TPA: hypothetical protein VM864_00280 [Pyrinomonadaceae bacterium]|jgi:hypothetical protein|nr:hypothetical protein [Pyrinomonadaceae bacterium]